MEKHKYKISRLPLPTKIRENDFVAWKHLLEGECFLKLHSQPYTKTEMTKLIKWLERVKEAM
jgi:hypothetical protein